MTDCGCKPGTYENGWREKRSGACRRAESEAFARSVELGFAWARDHILPVLPKQTRGGDVRHAPFPPVPAVAHIANMRGPAPTEPDTEEGHDAV